MRIGTWNLDGRWGRGHIDLLQGHHCDVWLLTEVSPKAVGADGTIASFRSHLSKGLMGRKQHWAAVLARGTFTPVPDPHRASAVAVIDGLTFCSTILPWAGCHRCPGHPWVGYSLGAMTKVTIDDLLKALPASGLVWGGDWNQNLAGGREYVGSASGRAKLQAAVESLHLQVPTAALPYRSGSGRHTIDHIAVPAAWRVGHAVAVTAEAGGKRLSDHDAYVVEVRAD
jgi:endonuclease/exonuclease/phosphatase family metal-dependent hydrolase